ncbi:MAG: lipid A phosphoethanolamine transferase [Bacteroidales bacterium]|nr:lipid A phosphoethanolamine transferase [Bacteroidales bacterium]
MPLPHVFRKPVSLWIFWILLSLFYGLTVIAIEFEGIPVSNFKSFLITGLKWGVITGFTAALLFLLSVNRYVFAITYPVLIGISAILSFYKLSIGVSFTPASLEMALNTDAAMWFSVITPLLILTFIAAMAIAIWTVHFRWHHVRTGRYTVWAGLMAAAIIILLPMFNRRFHETIFNRLPYALFFTTREYLNHRETIAEQRPAFDAVSCQASATPPDLFFVLGESLRADHLPQNGYPRNTLPRLSQDSALLSFPNIYTEHTHTGISVPHILTRADSTNRRPSYQEPSFVHLFQKAGYATAWFANQDISESYTYFAHECDTLIYCTLHSLYFYKKWLDRDMLPHLSAWLGQTDTDAPKLAILHTIGSHWWYKSHYPDSLAIFLPDIHNKDAVALSHEQIVNAYDNTIVATDDFLHRLFDLVKDRNTIVVYISDHGEPLGEDGLYHVHGNNSAPLHRPACMIWYSPRYAATFPNKVSNLKANRLNPARTDAIFHTVLDLGDLATPVIKPEMSLGYRIP